MPKFTHKKIIDKIYKANLNLYIGEEDDFLKRARAMCGGNDDAYKEIVETLDGSCGLSGMINNYWYIWLEKKPNGVKDMGVFLHELNHFVDNVFAERGIPPDRKNMEVRAYYFEYLYNEIIKNLYVRFKKRKTGDKK